MIKYIKHINTGVRVLLDDQSCVLYVFFMEGIVSRMSKIKSIFAIFICILMTLSMFPMEICALGIEYETVSPIIDENTSLTNSFADATNGISNMDDDNNSSTLESSSTLSKLPLPSISSNNMNDSNKQESSIETLKETTEENTNTVSNNELSSEELKGHHISYNDKGDGTHIGRCQDTDCEYFESPKLHIYVEGYCTLCGAKEETNQNEELGFEYSEILEGYIVSLSAEAGIFPAGTYVTVVKAPEERNREIEKIVESQVDEEQEISNTIAFDITFYDVEGNVIEPDDGRVSVTIKLADEVRKAVKETETSEVQVFHINDNEIAEIVTSEINEEEIKFV